jgi:hypothetical protein
VGSQLVYMFLAGTAISFGWALVDKLISLSPPWNEIRVSILLFVAYMSSLLLLRNRQPPPLTSTLIELRRKLGLRQLTVKEAKRQIEISFEGLRLSDVLQQDIDEFLGTLRDAIVSREQIVNDLRDVATKVKPGSNGIISEGELHLVNLIAKTSKSRLEDEEGLWDVARDKVDRIGKKLLRFNLSSQFKTEVDELIEQLSAAVTDTRTKSKQTLEEATGLLDKMHAWVVDYQKKRPS